MWNYVKSLTQGTHQSSETALYTPRANTGGPTSESKERRAQRKRDKYAALRGDAYTPRANTGGPTSESKERRAQRKRDTYAAARGDAYKPRANARGPRPSKRQRSEPDEEVSSHSHSMCDEASCFFTSIASSR